MSAIFGIFELIKHFNNNKIVFNSSLVIIGFININKSKLIKTNNKNTIFYVEYQ